MCNNVHSDRCVLDVLMWCEYTCTHVGEAPGVLANLTQDPSHWSQGGGTRLPDSESSRGEPDKSTDRSDVRIENRHDDGQLISLNFL